jgi:hypothetical protein
VGGRGLAHAAREWLFRSFGEHYAGSLEVGGFLIVAVPGVAFTTARLRAIGPRWAGVFADLALGISSLGWSYRLPAMLLLTFVVAASWSSRAGWDTVPGRIVRLAVLLLALSPIDVTLQGGGHYWRVMPAVSGDFTMDGLLNGPKYGYVPMGGTWPGLQRAALVLRLVTVVSGLSLAVGRGCRLVTWRSAGTRLRCNRQSVVVWLTSRF